MGILKKKAVYVDPVEDAREAVEAALGSFLSAQETLTAATDTFRAKVEENDSYIRTLQSRNVTLLEEADRAQRVGDKLGELVI